MSQNNKLKEFIKKLVKEYTGTGASGGNAGDGNNITSPRPFPDDTSEIENYILKNVYGGDGGHYTNEPAGPSYNTHKFVRFEGLEKYIKQILDEIEADDYGDATLTTQGQMRSRFTKTGMPPGMMEEFKLLEKGVKALTQLKEQGQSADDAAFNRRLKAMQKAIVRFQMRHMVNKKTQAKAQAAKGVSDVEKSFNQQLDALKDQLSAIDNPQQGQQQQNENTMKDYFKDKNSNLMERMDSYRKEAKRNILMEGVMKTFFEMFDNGMTNEEIIQDYASKGTQVPETFVGTARKQYETYKKMKLELDMSEKEFKNSAKEIINNPEMAEQDSEEKQLASGLFKEEILKKQIIKELNKIK